MSSNITETVKPSLRWEPSPEDREFFPFRLMVGNMVLVTVARDHDSEGQPYYKPTSNDYGTSCHVCHFESDHYFQNESYISALMRTPQEAMRYVERELDLPELPMWGEP